MNYVSRIKELNVEQNTIAISWLGQAGFLIKTSSGRIIAIDPYFSDCVMKYIPEEGLGFKRLTPPLCEAGDIVFDSLLISHEHLDHFDVDSIKAMMSNDRTCIHKHAGGGSNEIMDMSRVHVLKGMANAPDCKVLATAIMVNWRPMHWVSYLIWLTKVYYSDTALNPEHLKVPIEHKPRVAILPINGDMATLMVYRQQNMQDCLGLNLYSVSFLDLALHKRAIRSRLSTDGDKALNAAGADVPGRGFIHSSVSR